MQNHDRGTITAAGTVKRPITAGKLSPDEKVPQVSDGCQIGVRWVSEEAAPLYSGPFIPKPTTVTAKIDPKVRTKYTVV